MPGIRRFQLARQNASAITEAPLLLATVPVSPSTPAKAGADPIGTAIDQAAASVPRLLTPQAVGEMLGVTERTLERWRMTGEGPKFCKLSRSTVRYQPDDVAAFIADSLRANTAQ